VSGNFPFSLPVATSRTRTTSSPTCLIFGVIFLARILAKMSVRDARVYTCTRVLYTIMYRVYTRLQTYTMGASLMSVSVHVGAVECKFKDTSAPVPNCRTGHNTGEMSGSEVSGYYLFSPLGKLAGRVIYFACVNFFSFFLYFFTRSKAISVSTRPIFTKRKDRENRSSIEIALLRVKIRRN